MPIYEYACQQCGRRFSLLVGVVAEESKTECPRCGSREVRKLISRIARVRPHEEAFERAGDEAGGMGDFDTPESGRRWAREMSGEFGGELGEDFEEAVESGLDEGEESEQAGEEDEEF